MRFHPCDSTHRYDPCLELWLRPISADRHKQTVVLNTGGSRGTPATCAACSSVVCCLLSVAVAVAVACFRVHHATSHQSSVNHSANSPSLIIAVQLDAGTFSPLYPPFPRPATLSCATLGQCQCCSLR